jgi:RHS repeat-associated protein
LTEVRYTPDISAPSTYSMFQLFWLKDRLTLYWQTDYPSVTTSKRYVSTDETNRPIDMVCWGVNGCSHVWQINPSAWGFDTNVLGPSIYQPILLAGQYSDSESSSYLNDGSTVHRPPIALNGYRSYDSFVGAYLQTDPRVDKTWSSYIYASTNPVGKADPFGLEGDWWFDTGESGNVYLCHDVSTGDAEVIQSDCQLVAFPSPNPGSGTETPPGADPPPGTTGDDGWDLGKWLGHGTIGPRDPMDYGNCLELDAKACVECVVAVYEHRVKERCDKYSGIQHVLCVNTELNNAQWYMARCNYNRIGPLGWGVFTTRKAISPVTNQTSGVLSP